MKIKVLDFDEFPGLRHCSISESSGEEYYHKILNSAFVDCYKFKNKLKVDLDGTDAYASSFLDEAFGNLVYDFSLKIVYEFLEIISNDEPHWLEMIKDQTFIQWEKRRKNNDAPVVTETHPAWFRLIDGKLTNAIWEKP